MIGAFKRIRVLDSGGLHASRWTPSALDRSRAWPARGQRVGLQIIDPEWIGRWIALLRCGRRAVTRAALCTIRDPAGLRRVSAGGRDHAPARRDRDSGHGGRQRRARWKRRSRRSPQNPGDGSDHRAGPLDQVRLPEIARLAARYRLPATRFTGLVDGGRAHDVWAGRRRVFVARVLCGPCSQGEKPADLPVQQPTKYEFSSISKPPRRSASMMPSRLCSPPTRQSNQAPRTHRASRREVARCSVAARAQQSMPVDSHLERHRRRSATARRDLPGPSRGGLCRRPQHRGRIPLCWGPFRAAAGTGFGACARTRR